MNPACILFDLDGTLVDSRSDLATAVNLMLNDLGREALPRDQIVSFVGEGILKLVERALLVNGAPPLSQPAFDAAMNSFREHYRAHLLDETVVYPGVIEMLSRLSRLPLVVVTNKPQQFTMPILTGLGLARFFKLVISGDTMTERKPSPVPLLKAAEHCQSLPANCLMVGDSNVDIIAGKAAGMKTAGYAGGFRGREELEAAGADYIFNTYAELFDLIEPT